MATQYEWDEAKRAANLRKHNLDFDDADRVYENRDKLTLPSGTISEARWKDIAIVTVGEETASL